MDSACSPGCIYRHLVLPCPNTSSNISLKFAGLIYHLGMPPAHFEINHRNHPRHVSLQRSLERNIGLAFKHTWREIESLEGRGCIHTRRGHWKCRLFPTVQHVLRTPSLAASPSQAESQRGQASGQTDVRHDACVGVASKYCSPTPGRSKYSGVYGKGGCPKVEDVTRPLPPLCATVALRVQSCLSTE